MLGSLARRERRGLWATLAIIIILAVGGFLYAASAARTRDSEAASIDARLVAQTELAPLLMPRDLEAPVMGDRAKELETAIADRITGTGPVSSVRVYSELGRILYDADPSVVGLKPTYVRPLIQEVIDGGARAEFHQGELQTYVPLWLVPGGTVAVAAMSQSLGPITAEAGRWTLFSLLLVPFLLLSVALFVMSLRAKVRVPSVTQVQTHPEFRATEDAKTQAERRAAAAEAALLDLRSQFRTTLEQLKETEMKLRVFEDETSRSGDDLRTIRDEIRETAERLHKAELDNNALRERLALRQRELDDYKSRAHAQTGQDKELAELRRRLEAAERRAAERDLEADRLQAELDLSSDRFHMVKLSEALREYEDQAPFVVDDEEDDLLEHPKVFVDPRSYSAPGKVR